MMCQTGQSIMHIGGMYKFFFHGRAEWLILPTKQQPCSLNRSGRVILGCFAVINNPTVNLFYTVQADVVAFSLKGKK